MNATTTVPELHRRILFALLWPVVRLCRRFQVPLDVLEGLTRLAYYEELRRSGKATQADVARIFGTSLRTVVGVEKRYRTEFLAPEYEVALSRRIEEALSVSEESAAALSERLDEDASAVQRALTELVAAGRLERIEADGAPIFRYRDNHPSLVRADLLSRIDGLKHQLEVLYAAVQQRFVPEDDDRPSVARTLSFLGTKEDVDKLAEELVRTLRLSAIDVEERALTEGGHDRYGLTFALAATEKPHEG